ncbi:MAG: hypothetical protein RI897_2542 [Verrucomicrobiota bacterium]|jgi:hypothetical protein
MRIYFQQKCGISGVYENVMHRRYLLLAMVLLTASRTILGGEPDSWLKKDIWQRDGDTMAVYKTMDMGWEIHTHDGRVLKYDREAGNRYLKSLENGGWSKVNDAADAPPKADKPNSRPIQVPTPAAGSDIRQVGALKVDLTPLRDWTEKKKGDRPLPHWKEAIIEAYLSAKNGATEAIVKIEGSRKHVLLTGLSPSQKQNALRLYNASAALVKANVYADMAAAQQTSLSGLATGGFVSGSVGYVNDVSDQWERNRNAQAAAAARVQMAEQQKLALEREVKAMKQWFVQSIDWAMNTGQVISGLELWTYGH